MEGLKKKTVDRYLQNLEGSLDEEFASKSYMKSRERIL